MTRKETDFLTRLLATFKLEAEEHVKQISAGLLELEKKPPSEKETELMEVVFREIHSFKGAARAVNQTQIESICQLLESIFAAMRRQQMSLSQALLDLLHRTVNLLR
ncbi:MAG TPA: Hpt domain-containing protein, partial [Acidobacteriota bacterium]